MQPESMDLGADDLYRGPLARVGDPPITDHADRYPPMVVGEPRGPSVFGSLAHGKEWGLSNSAN